MPSRAETLTPSPARPRMCPFGDGAARYGKLYGGVIRCEHSLALVLYLMFGPFAPLIFWSVNGFLLGANISACRESDGGPDRSKASAQQTWAYDLGPPVSDGAFACRAAVELVDFRSLGAADLLPICSTQFGVGGPCNRRSTSATVKPTRQDDPCDDRPENDRIPVSTRALFFEVVMFGGPCMGASTTAPDPLVFCTPHTAAGS